MAADNEGTGLASSLTDLMTSLAVIFILLFVSNINNTHERGLSTRNQIVEELTKELNLIRKTESEEKVLVKPDENDPLGLVVIVPHKLLNFAVDHSEIPTQGRVFLSDFAPKLVKTVCSPKFQNEISSVIIEGHTDPTGGDMHNVQLSQNRATAVAVEILTLAEQDQKCFDKVLSVSGRGKAEVMEKVLSTEQMAEARRVQFKIRVRSSEEQPLAQQLSSDASPGLGAR